jgi:hypothetical protein
LAPSTTPRLLVVTDPAQGTLATRTDGSMVLLVAAEGIPRSRLHTLAGQFLDDGNQAVVLVRQGRALRRPDAPMTSADAIGATHPAAMRPLGDTRD